MKYAIWTMYLYQRPSHVVPVSFDELHISSRISIWMTYMNNSRASDKSSLKKVNRQMSPKALDRRPSDLQPFQTKKADALKNSITPCVVSDADMEDVKPVRFGAFLRCQIDS